MKLYDEAFKAAALTVNAFAAGELEGYPADNGVSLPWICQMAVNAGAGDHLEIGTSWGASAIAVSLAKRAAGLPGKVYCIDPYPNLRSAKLKGGLKFANISGARRNFKAAEVDVTIIRSPSDPFPSKIKDKKFVSSYIDGDHIGDMPYKDLLACAERTQHFIGVDNYEEGYPDVLDAVHKFVAKQEWNLYFKNFLFVAFRTEQHPRGSLLSHRLEHA